MHKLKCLIIICFFINISLFSNEALFAQMTPEEDAFISQQRTECSANSAMEWSQSLNKCIGKVAAVESRHEAQSCQAITDLKQREACHLGLAEKKTGVSADIKYEGKNGSLMLNGAYTIVSVINFTGKGGVKSSCTSKKIFGLAAVAGLATDVLLKMQAKKKVKSLEGKYKLETEMPANTAQIKALEYLKEEQETISKIAGQEKNRNMLLTIGYGAAGAVALYEIATGRASTPNCSAPSKNEGEKPEAPLATPAGAGANPTEGVLSNVSGLLGNSKGILVMSAIGAVYSGMLMSAAAKQEIESKENAKKIDKIIKTFNDSFKNFCPNGREKIEEPKCYCYNEDGLKNTNRTNSQICQELWKKGEYDLDKLADNYNLLGGKVDPSGCVNLNGRFDEKCTCKKFVDAKGVNACMKATNINMPAGLGTNFGEYAGVKQLGNFVSNLGNGNASLASLDSSALQRNAINAKNARDQLLSKLGAALSNDILALSKIDEKNVDKYSRAALGDKAVDSMMKSSPLTASSLASSRGGNEKINDLLKQAELKTGLDLGLNGGKGINNKNSKKDPVFNFMGDNSGGAGPGGQIVQGFEEKTYKYKNSDIVPDENASIFEIISNRYVQSGLRRLFDDNESALKN